MVVGFLNASRYKHGRRDQILHQCELKSVQLIMTLSEKKIVDDLMNLNDFGQTIINNRQILST